MHHHTVTFCLLFLTAALVYGHAGVEFVVAPPLVRLLNGTEAKPGQFPFIVSLQNYNGHICGGTIVNQNFVVTAAHCVEHENTSGIKIVAGTNVLSEGGQEREVKEIIIHENYNPSDSWRNDIAVLQLQTPLIMGDLVKPTSLPPQDYETPAGSPATVIGWGKPYTGGTIMNKLQYVGIQVYSDEDCDNIFRLKIYPTNICAGVPGGGMGHCSGDSGGPLVSEGYQVGIVSWSVKPCTQPPYPGVYTQVSKYTNWINNHVNASS